MHVRCMYIYIYIIHECVAPFSINLEVVAANTCNYGLGVELIEDGSISSKMTGICPLINCPILVGVEPYPSEKYDLV